MPLTTELPLWAIFQSAPIGIAVVDPAGRYVQVNPALQRILGYAAEDLRGRHFSEISSPEDLAETERLFQELIEGARDDFRQEKRYVRPDGQAVWAQLSVAAVRDTTGALLHTVSMIEDISQRKRAEEALRRNEIYFRSLIRNAPDVITVLSAETTIRYMSPAVYEVLGYRPDELEGRRIFEIVHPDDQPHVVEALTRAARDPTRPQRADFRVRHKNGAWRLAESIGQGFLDDTGAPRIIVNSRDITEYRRAEDEIRRAVSLLTATLEATADGILVVDRNGNIESFNRRFLEMWRIPDEIVMSRLDNRALQFVLEQLVDPAAFLAKVESLYADPEAESYDVLDFIDGRVLERTSMPQRIGGRPVGRVWSFRDVTDRRRAEQALRNGVDLLQAVIEGVGDAVFAKDLDGRYLMMNSAAARLLRRPVSEVVGHTDEELFPDRAVRFLASDRRIMTGGAAETTEETEHTPEGLRKLLVTKGSLRDQAGGIVGVIGVVHDFTERQLLEDQLRHAQKMEAVGQLAGGVAHDFGNLITAILGYSDLLLRAMPGDDARRPDVQEIRNTAARAGSLTRQLLAYSRRQLLTPQVLDLSALVADVATMLRRVIGEDIQLTTRASPAPARVRADASQIEQVLLNLAVNGRDAMPDGGQLTIETAVVARDEEFARLHAGTAPGSTVRLVVRDSGVGMDARTKAHLFEPFFTTKEPGKGTGLGLATVYGIVQQSGGSIWVDSEPGRGSTFTIALPRVDRTSDPRLAAPALELPRGSETLLLVEDEPAVRAPACDILRECGYRVLPAASGDEALRLVAGPDAPHADLLITDVVMPKMKGPELAGQLRARFPTLPVLFTSGYANSPNMAEWLQQPRTSFLQKPFTPEDLARRVREILDAR